MNAGQIIVLALAVWCVLYTGVAAIAGRYLKARETRHTRRNIEDVRRRERSRH